MTGSVGEDWNELPVILGDRHSSLALCVQAATKKGRKNSFVIMNRLPGTAGLSPRARKQAILHFDVTFTSGHVASLRQSSRDCSLPPNECRGIPNEAILLAQ